MRVLTTELLTMGWKSRVSAENEQRTTNEIEKSILSRPSERVKTMKSIGLFCMYCSKKYPKLLFAMLET